MKQFYSSFLHAFAMYSKIPMPRVSWKKEDMKYSMCFFPLIGMVIGFFLYFAYLGMEKLQCTSLFKAVILTVIPILITGGIHMDGFIDTVDARNSYGEKEKKLEILKDPHIGAFAMIKFAVYLMLMLGFFSQVSKQSIGVIALGFIYSRTLSGLSVVSFKNAKTNGLLATFSDSAQKQVVKGMLYLYLILCGIGMILLQPLIGSICFIIGFLVFLYYHNMSYKEFGGITGDLAGYFLQICELFLLIAAVVVDILLKS